MEHRKFPVLIVDDEVENLDAFTLNFSRKFTIRTATSGKDGLEIARAEPIAVAIADQRMPGMLGTDFLAELRKIRPDAVRMIVTGYTDLESVIAAINDGQISRYITKPWEAREIESIVKNAIDHYRRGLERRRRFRELTAYNRVLQLIAGERSLSRVVKEVLELVALEFGYAQTFLLLGDPQGDRPLRGQVVMRGPAGKPQVKKISAAAKGTVAPLSQVVAAHSGFSAERFAFSASPAERTSTGEEGTAEMLEFSCAPFYGAPLIVEGRVVGLLAADRGEGGNPRTDRDDARFISTLAAQIALATGGHLTAENLQRKGGAGSREDSGSSRPSRDPARQKRVTAPKRVDPRQYPVLLVDDDAGTLELFRLNFANQFDVLTTRSPREALDIARNRQVAVILTDQRMPDMSGIELLSELRDNDPDCVRMILTGYSDIDDIIGAVNRGLVYRYITKPWDPREVSAALKATIEYYHELVEARRLLREAEVVNRVMSVAGAEPDADRLADAALAIAVNDLGYDRAYLFRYDDETGHLVAGRAAAREGEALPAAIEKMRIPVIQGGGLLATVALTMEPARSTEGPHTPGGVEIAVQNRKVTLAVPIGNANPLGVLAAELSRASTRDFSASDELTLSTLSEVLAVSMQQARRLAELRALSSGGAAS